jgi:murein DD-endopeptidase MepM/ murein hydrolase activator NlpD
MYEIQLHPANIRKQVRYYFLSRRAFHWLLGALAGLAVVVLVGVVLVPLSLRALFLSGELRGLRQQKRLQLTVLTQRAAALTRGEREVGAARTRQRQMALILGMPEETTEHEGAARAETEPSFAPAAQALQRGLALEAASQQLLTFSGELARFAAANRELTAGVPSICPIPIGSFVMTSPFGDRLSPFTNAADFHAGIDLAAREGTPVAAAGGGRVEFAGSFPLRRHTRWWRFGKVVVLSHYGGYLTVYGHLDSITVRRGQQLRRGERLGTVGNTGWSASPHLHYEVRVVREGKDEAEPVDPRIFILNYQWKGHEALLDHGHAAPLEAFDPLPGLVGPR